MATVPGAGSSILFDTIGAQLKPASSSILFDTLGAPQKPASSSILFDTIDAQFVPGGSSTLFDTIGELNQPGGSSTLFDTIDTQLSAHKGAIRTKQLNIDSPLVGLPVTVNTLPNPNAFEGYTIFVIDETGGAVLAFSDGVNWLRTTDRAVVS